VRGEKGKTPKGQPAATPFGKRREKKIPKKEGETLENGEGFGGEKEESNYKRCPNIA